MKTKLHYVFSIAMLLTIFSVSGQTKFFKKASKQAKSVQNNKGTTLDNVYEFDYLQLAQHLSKCNKSISSKTATSISVNLPNLSGNIDEYIVTEASVMHPDLQAKYPDIRSYVGYKKGTPSSVIRFSLSPNKGFTGIVLNEAQTLTFKPVAETPNKISIQLKNDFLKDDSFECKTIDALNNKTAKHADFKDADDSLNRTYNIALSVTGEYADYHGGSLANVNAALVATLTNINAVFENELNVTLQLIANNDDVVYLDASNDPYSDTSNYFYELANTLDTVILEENYDLGHLISVSGKIDGNAGCVGCVCNNGGTVSINHKGSGYSTSTDPDGFNFDIDVLAHEIGHQFGANHTWTFDGNEGEDTQMEPGSGSTIMGYAGITGTTDLQSHSDPYFHAISIEQITNYIKSTSCAVLTNTGNTTPTVNAGSDLILPTGTPFKLVGMGSDADGDSITYCWEQINENNAATSYPDPNSSDSNSVLFRSFSPTTSNIRYFPNLISLQNGLNTSLWEKVPNVNRDADFRLTVRDNRAGGANNAHDDMRVTFSTSYGPFEITSQNTDGIMWESGTTELITWNVNNTDELTGASHVNILLSLDGGNTFNTLASNIPNNGSYSITVPNTSAPFCRIVIEPTNNNFFAMNDFDFSIDYVVDNTCSTFASDDPNLPIDILDNSKTLNESSTLNISDSGTITDLNLTLNLTHDWPGDIAMNLVGPDNTTENILVNYSPCQGEDQNIIVTFDDQSSQIFNCSLIGDGLTMQPRTLVLETWNEKEINGTWTINFGDFGITDIGTLNSWALDICYNTVTPLSTKNHFLEDLKIYPNPNNGSFTIEIPNTTTNNLNVNVVDLRGRYIYENTFKPNGSLTKTIDLAKAQTGVYFLNVTDGYKRSTKKIVIK